MALNWVARKRGDDVSGLIARGGYLGAIKLLKEQLAREPESVYLRQRVADTMVMAGLIEPAVQILLKLSDDFASDGFAAKAVAILKKIERIAPGREEVYKKLANDLQTNANVNQERKWSPSLPVAVTAPDHPDSESGLSTSEVNWAEVSLDSDFQPAGARHSVTTALFESFSPDELLPLLRGLRLVTYQPGDIVVSEGEPGDSLFILTTGRVKTFVRDAVGHFSKVRELMDGDFFGEISFLRSTPRTATITAAASCEMLILDKATLLQICETHPHVLEVLERFSAQRQNSAVEIEIRKSKAIDGGA